LAAEIKPHNVIGAQLTFSSLASLYKLNLSSS